MRKAAVVGAALLGVCVGLSLNSLFAQRTVNGDGGGGTASAVAVSVANFPQVQPVQVDKTVNVTGSVAVTNLPALQQVAGTVNVGNLPVDAAGNVLVSGTLHLPSASVRFVGYTQAIYREGTGLLELGRACDSEFTGSRMCEGMEMAKISPPPPAPAAPAMLVLFGSSTTWGTGLATVPLSSCMSAAGVPFACGGDPLPVACCS